MTERKRITPAWAVLAVVIVFELAYLGYFFSFELPNASVPGEPGKKYSRLDLWQLSIPGFIPDARSLPEQALATLSDVRYLPQRVPIILQACFIVAAAIAAGFGILRVIFLRLSPDGGALGASELTRIERLVVAYALGTTALSLATLGLGLAGFLNRAFVLAVLAGLIIVAGICWGRSTSWFGMIRRSNADRVSRSSDRTAATPARTERLGKRPGQRVAYSDSRQSQPTSPGNLSRMAIYAGAVAVGLFLVISFLGAMLPATDFDVREYHLQGPKEFYLEGRIAFAPHNVYMNMPFGTEMLSLLSMVVSGDWWWGALVGQTVLAVFAPMTALGIACLGRRLFEPAAGSLAALIYMTTPWVYRISIIPYTENALAFFLLAAVLVTAVTIGRAYEFPGGGWWSRGWLLAGLIAGSAAACKYTALISTVLPLGMVALLWPAVRPRGDRSDDAVSGERRMHAEGLFGGRLRRSSQAALLFGCGVAVTFGPWLAKNAVLTGNPTYPLLYGIFGGRHWTAEQNAKWEWGHRVALLVAVGLQEPPDGSAAAPNDPQHAITGHHLVTNLIDVTARADWLSPLLFALAPLALLSARGRAAALVWVMVVYLFLQWWLLTHRLDRFWVPMIPLVAVLAGAGAMWRQDKVWRIFVSAVIVLVVFYNFSFCTTALCGYNQYTDPLRSRTDPIDPLVNWMNDQLPDSARILSVGAADLFHLDRPVVYNTVFDESIFERWARGRSPREVALTLEAEQVTHVFVSWAEIVRYRAPGSYGFTDFVTPDIFRRLQDAGVLRPMVVGPQLDDADLIWPSGDVPYWVLYSVTIPEP